MHGSCVWVWSYVSVIRRSHQFHTIKTFRQSTESLPIAIQDRICQCKLQSRKKRSSLSMKFIRKLRNKKLIYSFYQIGLRSMLLRLRSHIEFLLKEEPEFGQIAGYARIELINPSLPCQDSHLPLNSMPLENGYCSYYFCCNNKLYRVIYSSHPEFKYDGLPLHMSAKQRI